MQSLFLVTDIFLGFLKTMMVIYGIMSLLVFFNVLNAHGRIVGMVWYNMNGLFDPLLRPIRRIVPSYNGFDWSFLILYLLIILVQSLLREYGPLGAHAAQSALA